MPKIFLPVLLIGQFFISTAQESGSPKNYTKIHISGHLDTLIRDFTPEIKPDSIKACIQALQDFGTRYANAPNRKAVALWIKNKYMSFGITDVVIDSFLLNTTYQYNVIATIPGSIDPNKVYIIGGHSDAITSTNPMVSAPGADDNASGTVAAIEIARILKKLNYHPETTIKFMAFGAEELGLHGSKDYSKKARNANMDIGLMINNDMIAYIHDTATIWRVRLCKYTGSEWACDLARDISDIYTQLVPFVSTTINSGGSDSYPFWEQGYYVFYYFEPVSTPNYHTENDVVANCNMNYCAEVVRSNAGLLLTVSESPVMAKNISLSDMGNGTGLFAKWNRNKEPDLAGYRIYVGTSSNNYTVFHNSTDTSFIIPGLTAGTTYYIGISAYDTKGNESVSSEKNCIPALTPKTPANFYAGPAYKKIKMKWSKNSEYDILGYNIYRSATSGQNFIKLNNTPINDTTYTDSLVNINAYYFYKLTAVDSLLHESQPTAEIKSKAASFDKGVLLVDDSEGGLLSPSDQQVDDFYNLLLSNYRVTNYDAYKTRTISVDTMSHYSSILWHIENSAINAVFFIKLNEIKKYLDAGGNMILTFDRPAKVILHTLTYPVNLTSGSFIYDYLKIKKIDLTASSRFIGARPIMNGYDSVYIDLLKTPTEYNHHIANVEALYADSIVANNIFVYDSQYDIASPQGLMKNKPVGVEYSGSDFNIVTLSFPLYYMNTYQSKSLVDYIMQYKFHEPLGIKEKIANYNFDFTLSPNPVKSQAVISYYLSEKSRVNISIYNMTGVLVKTITDNYQNLGSHQLEFSVSDLNNGVYLCKMTSGNSSVTRKVVVLK
jgi:hypothetical protein